MRRIFNKRFSMTETIGLLAFVVVGVAVYAYAVTTVPYTFTSGTTAKASEVNANFSALATAINSIPAGPAGPQGPQGPAGPPGPGTRTVRNGTCSGGAVVSAPEVSLSDPPLVEVWIASSQGITVRQSIGFVGIGEGSVIMLQADCPNGWFYSVVTVI